MPLRCASLFADVNVANTQTAVGLLRVLTLAVLGSVASHASLVKWLNQTLVFSDKSNQHLSIFYFKCRPALVYAAVVCPTFHLAFLQLPITESGSQVSAGATDVGG